MMVSQEGRDEVVSLFLAAWANVHRVRINDGETALIAVILH